MALVTSIILLVTFIPPMRPSLGKIPRLRETDIVGATAKEPVAVNVRD
jgi:hypothetical protein